MELATLLLREVSRRHLKGGASIPPMSFLSSSILVEFYFNKTCTREGEGTGLGPAVFKLRRF